MILPDVNLLIYAHNVRAVHHPKARQWWNDCLAGPEGVALAWTVILGFVRISTNPKISDRPMGVNSAMERVKEWLDLPHIQVVHPGEQHFNSWSSLLRKIGTAGNLTSDAHLAALAMERGLVLYTTDADFARFPGLKWRNPLQEDAKGRKAPDK
jgi:toxin-antitoxin system PIN domain toxin